MKSSFILFLLAIFLPIKLANAAIYYVDAAAGNDKWSGQQPSPAGSPVSDGPWQSLSKVSAQAFMPGDSVLLKCGSTWYESLKLSSSGTSANPISIGTYPAGCTNKPLINGALPVPGQNWINDAGNIYKLSSVIDLITYGSFENGLGNWATWSPQNNATVSLVSNCAQAGNCVSYTAGTGTGNSLFISNNFALQGGQAYNASFAVNVPAGTSIWVTLRRNATPWDAVGFTRSIAGTGAWQTVTLPFTAAASVPRARLDFSVPAGKNIGVDDVRITSDIPNVGGVFVNGRMVNVAHFPNRGYDPKRPDSLYFYTAADSQKVLLPNGRFGSAYVTTGTDFAALPHPDITPGTGIRIRTSSWVFDDRKVASVSGSSVNLDSPTEYPVSKDWGYFFYGQRWMLDEPGEWSYEPDTKTVSIWMPDSLSPGDRVSLGQLGIGIEASNRSYIRIDGIAIRDVETGIAMGKATGVVLTNMYISDTLGAGIDATGSIDSGVESSEIDRTTGSAIYAGHFGGVRFHAYGNGITDSGVVFQNGVVTSLPSRVTSAISSGRESDIRDNRIYNTGYVGIFPLGNSVVSGNDIENACLVFDDCGGIYTGGQYNTGTTIENNTIQHVIGGLPGKPATTPSEAQGIYLDELLSGATVRGNTAIDADNGIQVHNAANNLIENNTFYGNRRQQIWLQEGTNVLDPQGDVHDNQIIGNLLFPTSVTPAVRQQTYLAKTDTDRFANFDQNRYFTYLYPTMASESWPAGSAVYTLPQWRAATTPANGPRNLDPTGIEVNSATMGYAAFRVLGANIVPNGNFSAGTTGWHGYNSSAPYGQITLASCDVVGACLTYTAGGTVSLLSSPNFSVKQDQWYKASFDLKTGVDGQAVYVVVRRGDGGGNGYEYLMDAPYTFAGATAWHRYSFIFKATETVNAGDPVTGDLGARVDFPQIAPGQNISVGNLELVPLSSVDATVRTNILVNPGASTLSVDCPDGNGAPVCSQYVRFSDNQSVTWPYSLLPHASEAIYTRDSSLVDQDGDGIADSQDSCSGTAPSTAVNGEGCALGQ